MTPQEQQLLTQLTQRINQTQLQEKDPDAENLLGKELGANPDALYILAQTVLVQDIALQRANSHIADLEKQLEEEEQQLDEAEQQLQQQAQQHPQPARATSFLGRLFGEQPAVPPPVTQQQYQPPYQPEPYQAAPQYAQQAPVPVYGQNPGQFQPVYNPMQAAVPMGMPVGPVFGGGQPSFLRGAMQTAAGVAAGSLAFEGVESLLHGIGGFGHPGFGGGGGFGGFGGGFGGERPVEEVVNNYYGDAGEHERGAEHHAGDFSDSGHEHFHESSYEDNRGYDNSLDNSQFDNGGGLDDGGGFGSGGDVL